jgi:hypothetical protein
MFEATVEWIERALGKLPFITSNHPYLIEGKTLIDITYRRNIKSIYKGMTPTDRISALNLSPPSLDNKHSLPTITHLPPHRLDRLIKRLHPPLRPIRIPLPIPLPPQVIIKLRRLAHVLLCQLHPTSRRRRTRARPRTRTRTSTRRPTLPALVRPIRPVSSRHARRRRALPCPNAPEPSAPRGRGAALSR